MADKRYTPSFITPRKTLTGLSSKLSRVKIKIDAKISAKRENFCFAPLCSKAERIAIPKSSLLVAIA